MPVQKMQRKAATRTLCPQCGRRTELGECKFGGGVPIGPHCRGCCSAPERDGWRAARHSVAKRAV